MLCKGTSKAGVHGDWIHELDLSVGQLVDALDRMKIADNTLIILTSDNGGDDQLVPQLYNLAEDPAETRNVLSEHPEIAAELSALLETWRKQGHSRP